MSQHCDSFCDVFHRPSKHTGNLTVGSFVPKCNRQETDRWEAFVCPVAVPFDSCMWLNMLAYLCDFYKKYIFPLVMKQNSGDKCSTSWAQV